MADELDALLARVDDDALRQDLTAHITRLRQRRQFGLVFEEHLPERVALPQHAIRRGIKVVTRDGGPEDEPRVVLKVRKGKATLAGVDGDETVDVDDLVAVAEFGEPIYPGLKQLGSIERGGDKPAHVVIKGENYHALEALQFTHAGKVDCIYIDPPYNTGARDWKYNNDYVDGDDAYRHSKWLAMMQRRLRLALELLNPEASVLVVAIDEKEVLRLGLLLEQLFPHAKTQLVSVVINAAGQSRLQELGRVNEFLFFVFLGEARPVPVSDDLLNEASSTPVTKVRWESLLRSGTNSRRSDRPNLFFPVFVDGQGEIAAVGESLPETFERGAVDVPQGTTAVWPLKSDGAEGNWRTSPDYLRGLLAEGYAKAGKIDLELGRGTFWYLGKAAISKIGTGEIEVIGREACGAVQVVPTDDGRKRKTAAKTIWNRSAHHSGWYGSAMVRALLPGRSFPFPKSLYAVEDALRICVGDNPNAVVLDFFAGSGTTAHAVLRMNRQDAGQRSSISITNNEVSNEDAGRLSESGLRPGEPGWEQHGIFEYFTRPRLAAAVTGTTEAGEAVEGHYKFTDESPMADGFEESLQFLELHYLDPEAVALDRAFEAVAPLLWMRAGSTGPILDSSHDNAGRKRPYVMSDSYAVLFNPDRWRSFVEKLAPTVTHVFVVTDSSSEFANVSAELPADIEVVRLYENYLSTFAINTGAPS